MRRDAGQGWGCRTERGHYRVEGQKSRSFGPSKEGRRTGCCAVACIVLQCYVDGLRQITIRKRKSPTPLKYSSTVQSADGLALQSNFWHGQQNPPTFRRNVSLASDSVSPARQPCAISSLYPKLEWFAAAGLWCSLGI